MPKIETIPEWPNSAPIFRLLHASQRLVKLRGGDVQRSSHLHRTLLGSESVALGIEHFQISG